MGNLLKLLSRDDPVEPDIFVDFENAQPTETELDVYLLVEKVLRRANFILQDLKDYTGAAKEIREAINNSNDSAVQLHTWTVLVPLVHRLKCYYDLAMQLEAVVPLLLWELCAGPLPPLQLLEERQALAKLFAEILDFVLSFDELKITTPAIQNDFSFFRRSLSKMQQLEVCDDSEICGELANRMSLFLAQPNPMLSSLSKATQNFVSQNKDLPLENTTDTLSTMADVCRKMVENPDLVARFRHEDSLMFCLRVMTACVILFDLVHPVGAFAKSSPLDTKAAVKLLKSFPTHKVENLLNALRYTTKHLNDESTPKGVKSLLLDGC